MFALKCSLSLLIYSNWLCYSIKCAELVVNLLIQCKLRKGKKKATAAEPYSILLVFILAGNTVGPPCSVHDSMVFPSAVTSRHTTPSVTFSFQLRPLHFPRNVLGHSLNSQTACLLQLFGFFLQLRPPFSCKDLEVIVTTHDPVLGDLLHQFVKLCKGRYYRNKKKCPCMYIYDHLCLMKSIKVLFCLREYI